METTTLSAFFDTAARVHRAQPNADTLALVTSAAILLMGTPVEAPTTSSQGPRVLPASSATFTAPDKHEGDFYEIRATFDRLLTPDEALTAAACTGYALKKYFNGEPVGEPLLQLRTDGTRRFCETLMSYDSTKAQRSDPNTEEAFALAATYIVEGTPVRTTDKAGRGTKGTKLSEGIGPVGVTFAIR